MVCLICFQLLVVNARQHFFWMTRACLSLSSSVRLAVCKTEDNLVDVACVHWPLLVVECAHYADDFSTNGFIPQEAYQAFPAEELHVATLLRSNNGSLIGHHF